MGAFSRGMLSRTMVKTIVLASEPVSKAGKNRRRYEGGAENRGKRKRIREGETIMVLVVVLAFLVYSWMKTVEESFSRPEGILELRCRRTTRARAK